MRVLTCPPQTEVRGDVLLSLVDNLQAEHLKLYLEKHRLNRIEPGKWYELCAFQNLLNELNQLGYSSLNFVAIGISVAEDALMPDDLHDSSFKEIVENWDLHFRHNHRNGDIGQKVVEKLSHNYYKITLKGGIYPDDLEYGVLYGFARKYLPHGSIFKVWYDEQLPRLDRGMGKYTVMYIQWE